MGGAVRDALRGAGVHDADWVVTGVTPAEMVAAGFSPVGRDFPVFLHPHTKQEYALARTERKSGQGYAGFTVYAAPGVTLEQDLARRDFTINAIAVPAERLRGAGDFHNIHPSDCIDPFGGLSDLKTGILRHVSPAFSEDPLRILRGARFMARFGDELSRKSSIELEKSPAFQIHPETLDLMQRMVQNAELSHLSPERIWQEISRGLMEHYPSAMFRVLQLCGALPILFPKIREKLDDIFSILDNITQDLKNQAKNPLPIRWAIFCTAAPDTQTAIHWGKILRVPNECAQLADLVLRNEIVLKKIQQNNEPRDIFDFLQNCDAWRRPERVAHILGAAGSLAWLDKNTAAALLHALKAASAIDTAAVAARAREDFQVDFAQNPAQIGPHIAQHIAQARMSAIVENQLNLSKVDF